MTDTEQKLHTWPLNTSDTDTDKKKVIMTKKSSLEKPINLRRWSEDLSYGKGSLPVDLRERKVPIMTEKLFKVIIVGDPTVGKTAFVQRYVSNDFKRDFKGTVGVDFSLKLLAYSEFQVIKLQLWDIAGQERFTWMTRVYYKDAHGCIIIFDLTNRTSFLNTLKWKQDVDSKCTLSDGSSIPCILLGNKCDLSSRKIDQMEIETFAKEHNFIGWTEVSAKEGLMVNDTMKFLVDTMLRVERDVTDAGTETLRLRAPDNNESANSRCFC